MSKIKFTPEQQDILRSNRYTARVSASTLSLSKEFKDLFYQELLAGALPRDILRKYGYPIEILGQKRIWGIAHCIRKEYAKKASATGMTNEEAKRQEEINQLNKKIDRLRLEIDFLTKIALRRRHIDYIF